MAATGTNNPRGGDKSIHMKSRMWDRLMTDAALHGGLRALTYGDGTMVVYDPVLTPQDADTALPEWLTGHPAVTSYPLSPAHAGGTGAGITVYRHPGQRNDDRAGYDPISLQPLGRVKRACEVCGEPGTRIEYKPDLSGDRRVIAWMCTEHAAQMEAAPRCGWDSACDKPAKRYRTYRADDPETIVLLCDDHAAMARTFLNVTGGNLTAAE